MVVWMGLVGYVALLKYFLKELDTQKKKKKFLFFCGIGVVFVMGSRYPDYIGSGDLSIYYGVYKSAIDLPLGSLIKKYDWEMGYTIFNKMFAAIIPWPQMILYLEAAFCFICVAVIIYKYSDDLLLAVLIYITLGTMTFQLTGFRQSFAMSICLLSVLCIEKRRFICFVILIALAATFHRTAIVFLPFYFVAKLKPNIRNVILMTIGFIVISFFLEEITHMANEILDREYSGYWNSVFAGIVPILFYLCGIVLALIYDRQRENHFFLNMLIIGLAIYCMRYVTQAFERIAIYYTPAIIIALPNALDKIKDKQLKMILTGAICFALIMLFLHRINSSLWGEYVFFWNK